MSKYDWSSVLDDVKFLTTSENGKVSGWVQEYRTPNPSGGLWYGGDIPQTGEPKYYGLNIAPYQGDWRESLEERPND